MAGVLPIARPEAARWPTSLCHHGLAEKTSHPKHRDAPGRTSQSQSARPAQIVLSLQKRWRTMRSPISKTASAHFCAYVYVPLEISSVVLEEQPPPAAKQGQSSTRSKEKKMGGKKRVGTWTKYVGASSSLIGEKKRLSVEPRFFVTSCPVGSSRRALSHVSVAAPNSSPGAVA